MNTLLPTTTYSGTSTVTGVKQKGDGYYGHGDGLHTVSYFLSGFVGVIVIQGTVVADPTESDWFDVTSTTVGDGSTVLTENSYKNFNGNFTWVRVSVTDFSAGVISKIQYRH